MMSAVGSQWSVVSVGGRVSCLLLSAFCLLGCSVPNLEPADCTQARDVVREFYSFHFGNETTFSAENLEKRKQFLTPDFYQRLKNSEQRLDPFTLTNDPPKAFRVGECQMAESGVRFNVLLFWKTDTRTEQRPVTIGAENIDNKWRIARVDNDR